MQTDKELNIITKAPHYNTGKHEVITVIERLGLGFNIGNALKYIARAGKKDAMVQDLKKAEYYIKREITFVARNGDGAQFGNVSFQETHTDKEYFNDVVLDWNLSVFLYKCLEELLLVESTRYNQYRTLVNVVTRYNEALTYLQLEIRKLEDIQSSCNS